ncbi:DEAD/DEAH box helicase [Bremerella sp. JC770]|uniref:DEAD/DEAH box helicase n=1 Tax=Bremerella sp. JC770 TaxID=3232137 RepID=UPI003458D662
MVFRKKKKTATSYSDPEALFRDLRNRTVEGLLSHQSDILRRYIGEAFDEPDVALELPTGSGKTLVGLLIAEFRRVTRQERVLYLCPTKQLVLQVCEQAERKYGMKATPFVGKVKDYAPTDKHAYQSASSLAVATYSALFNTNPFFTSSHLIILDDAHASENYIASNWSLNIPRRDHENIYFGLLSVFEKALPSSQVQRFRSEERDEQSVKMIEMVSTASLVAAIDTISPFLDEHTAGTDLRYPWSLLHGHLAACQMFFSYDGILIRPFIPPTLTHAPFAEAKQRVYMSATLGLGGDLERMTGIERIHRLPIPAGWEKQGIGRRFFIFPDLSLQGDEVPQLAKQLVDEAGRALVLVPSDKKAEPYVELFDDREVCSATDIEQSKDKFVADDTAVAVLANRYDGIDLSGDECRMLVIEGLPKAGNLQELFFMSRMAASIVLNDRIRTRIIQAVGRCTRSATDYAAVCIIGDDFSDWLLLDDKRSLFHPELQGELKFGAEQSADRTASDFVEALKVFLDHDEEWNDVDADIREHRDESIQKMIPGQNELFSAAAKEVKYQYRLWDEDYESCVKLSQEVAALLSGNDLRGFRGFWNYLGASACELASVQLGRDDFIPKAAELYNRAAGCLPALSWLRVHAARLAVREETESEDIDPFIESNIERMELLFDGRSYTTPHRFERDVAEIMNGLASDDDSDAFEEAFRRLGELLGFHAENSDGNAAPDPWWVSDNSLCLVSEAKNDSKPEHAVSVRHTRQAASHQKWIKDKVDLADDAEIHTVMVTPARTAHADVRTYAEDVGWWHIDEFRQWARDAIGVIRDLRSTFTGTGNIAWRDKVRGELLEHGLDPRSIIKTATATRLRDVPNE